jgi:hypothetical protein
MTQIPHTGLRVSVGGTTVEQHPELAGQVLGDASRAFVFTNPASEQQLAFAIVQDRVVRSNMSGRLHCYFRVREFHRSQSDLTLTVVARGPFLGPPLEINCSLDGLGDVQPQFAEWPISSTELRFSFGPPTPLEPGKSSLFVCIQSSVTEFVDTGVISSDFQRQLGWRVQSAL